MEPSVRPVASIRSQLPDDGLDGDDVGRSRRRVGDSHRDIFQRPERIQNENMWTQ